MTFALTPGEYQMPVGRRSSVLQAAFLQQVAAHFLAGAALEQYVVRHHHRGAAVDLEQRVDVLDEVELLVAGRGPEILADDDLIFLLRVAFLVHEQQTLLLAEGRVGEHHRILAAPRRGQTVMPAVDDDLVAADAVQIGVHRAHAADLGRQLHALDQFFLQRPLLIAVEVRCEAVEHILIGVAEKAAGARRRIADGVVRGEPRHLAHGLDHRARREVLARAARRFLCRACQQLAA